MPKYKDVHTGEEKEVPVISMDDRYFWPSIGQPFIFQGYLFQYDDYYHLWHYTKEHYSITLKYNDFWSSRRDEMVQYWAATIERIEGDVAEDLFSTEDCEHDDALHPLFRAITFLNEAEQYIAEQTARMADIAKAIKELRQ